ncbi:MAG TPA: SDR family oxidoreductase [Pirellulales bacterium]|nr:SDR family oxidoreductase [Pirellulales bacterium]
MTARVAIVTGASRGIGEATALELAARGYDLTITARDRAALDRVRDSIEKSGRRARVVAGDLADLDFARQIVEQSIAEFGRIDVLVNNAAWRELISMRHITLESWERTLRICLTTPAFLARWAAASMEQRRSGVIINVSSMMSRQVAGISPAYIAAKGALESLTYELAALYGPRGIRVLTVSPGAIDTEMSNDYPEGEGEDASRLTRQYSEDMIMLGRWGTAVEIARLIAFAASEDASYLTATTLTADGGWQRQHMPKSLCAKQLPGDFP